MAEKNLKKLFMDQLRDSYYAERQILKALPKMERAAESSELAEAFAKHREETEGQVKRLEEVFEIMGMPLRGKTCPAIDGIIEEGDEVMSEMKGSPAIDAGLIAAAQAVEHYEIARYGALCAWARALGQDDAAMLLQETLEEEQATDEVLGEIAEGSANAAALDAA